MNCPFYGRHLMATPRTTMGAAGVDSIALVGTGGNQCALVFHALSPCIYAKPDWQACERVLQVLIDFHSRKPYLTPIHQDGATLHVLREGLPLCGFTLHPPAGWPGGHTWIGYSQVSRMSLNDITCPDCRERARAGLPGELLTQ